MIPCDKFQEDGSCEIGRTVPHECDGVCPSYLPDAERTPCEIWTRVMGYHRPLSAFNAGKKSEHRDRKFFVEKPNVLAE